MGWKQKPEASNPLHVGRVCVTISIHQHNKDRLPGFTPEQLKGLADIRLRPRNRRQDDAKALHMNQSEDNSVRSCPQGLCSASLQQTFISRRCAGWSFLFPFPISPRHQSRCVGLLAGGQCDSWRFIPGAVSIAYFLLFRCHRLRMIPVLYDLRAGRALDRCAISSAGWAASALFRPAASRRREMQCLSLRPVADADRRSGPAVAGTKGDLSPRPRIDQRVPAKPADRSLRVSVPPMPWWDRPKKDPVITPSSAPADREKPLPSTVMP